MSIATERVQTDGVHGLVEQDEATGDNLLRGGVLLLCFDQTTAYIDDLLQQVVDVVQGSGEGFTG